MVVSSRPSPTATSGKGRPDRTAEPGGHGAAWCQPLRWLVQMPGGTRTGGRRAALPLPSLVAHAACLPDPGSARPAIEANDPPAASASCFLSSATPPRPGGGRPPGGAGIVGICYTTTAQDRRPGPAAFRLPLPGGRIGLPRRGTGPENATLPPRAFRTKNVGRALALITRKHVFGISQGAVQEQPSGGRTPEGAAQGPARFDGRQVRAGAWPRASHKVVSRAYPLQRVPLPTIGRT